MKNNSLKYLINTIFKILGLYEKIKSNEDKDNFTVENYIIYIEKTLVDINALKSLYEENEVVSTILEKCQLSILGILDMVKTGKDDHKMIRSKVLDMTNDISRYLEE